MLINRKNSNLLDVEVKKYNECGYCKEQKKRLDIPWRIWSEWKFISDQMGQREWGCMFWVKDGTITRYIIPRQEVSSSECEFKEELGGDGIVHSHHTMGAFHSGQDDAHARNLYIYSIVIASDGHVATQRALLPCGGMGHIPLEIVLTDCPDVNLDKIQEKQFGWPQGEKNEYNFMEQYKRRVYNPCEDCQANDCSNCHHFDAASVHDTE